MGAPGDAYETLDALKGWLGINDTQDDTVLTWALLMASRRIDEYCGREGVGFNLSAAPSARVFSATHPELLAVDDIGSLTGLAVGVGPAAGPFTAYGVSDVDYLPSNAIAKGFAIEVLRHTACLWPTSWPGYRVQVTAQWGWPAVPDLVQGACRIEAAKLFRRKDSPAGVLQGTVTSPAGPLRVSRLPLDPDAQAMVDHFVREGMG